MRSLPDLEPGYVRRYVSETGGCVDVHETHGKQELRQNLPVAVFLADLGEHVCLLPVARVPGTKSADASRNGIVWEFKTLEGITTNAVDTALRHASKQAAHVLLAVPASTSLEVLEQAMFNRLRRTARVVALAILRDKSLFSFTRDEVVQNTFRGKIL